MNLFDVNSDGFSRGSSLASPYSHDNRQLNLSFLRTFLKRTVTRKEPSGAQDFGKDGLEHRSYGTTNGSASHC